MVTVSAQKYIKLGHQIEAARSSFVILESFHLHGGSDDESRVLELKAALRDLIKGCEELNLTRAQELLSHAYDDVPQSGREFDLLMLAVMTDIRATVFLYIPEHLAKYYEIIFQSIITVAFPLASKELVWAGNSLACGLYTGCVFHSMRAAEIGMRVLAGTLGVSFPDKPLELAEWQNVLDQTESKIRGLSSLQPKQHRDEELHFYSQAAVQFRYFKDAWRVRVAHARESYEERDALKIFTHTHEFFETLASRLREPKPPV